MSKIQKRDAPAYQEYAASMLSKFPFRTASLQERGLIYTMRLECWVNSQLPRNPKELAKVLGVPVEQVESSLDAVMPFFACRDGYIICPELENYRAHLEDRKNRQSSGGKAGAAKTNSKRKRSGRGVDIDNTSTSQVARKHPDEYPDGVLVQSSTEKESQTQPYMEVSSGEINAGNNSNSQCTPEEYARQSGGDWQ